MAVFHLLCEAEFAKPFNTLTRASNIIKTKHEKEITNNKNPWHFGAHGFSIFNIHHLSNLVVIDEFHNFSSLHIV